MPALSSTAFVQKAMTHRAAPMARGRPSSTLCVASAAPTDVAAPARRAAAAAVAALQLLALPASAMWDGESSAIGSCPLGDAGTECRSRILARDGLGSYSSAVDNATKVGGMATGIPVAKLDSQYQKDTAVLADAILQYLNGDVYDEARPALVKTLKTDGAAWVSKYARGGSARTTSARKFYIAVDAVGGHVASNGLAPFPRNKAEKVVNDITEAVKLLQEGK